MKLVGTVLPLVCRTMFLGLAIWIKAMSLLGKRFTEILGRVFLFLPLSLSGCGDPLNNPYPPEDNDSNTLYTSFEERPKHLDPALAYSANEYEIIAQVYEPLLQYAYLSRPYQLIPFATDDLPEVQLLDARGVVLPENAPEEQVAVSIYKISLRSDLSYQPHPAFVMSPDGAPKYHHLTHQEAEPIRSLSDFNEASSRSVTAGDYAYQIKRLVHPQLHSPIGELMSGYILGLKELGDKLKTDLVLKQAKQERLDLREYGLEGVEVIDDRHLTIKLKGKYPQFRFWLAMPFFAPIPWEADAFYGQQDLIQKNITLDWYPIGSGPYMLTENNPNRRMILSKNPSFHKEYYPVRGEPGDMENGLLNDSGKTLPFIDRVIFVLEKETIPYWSKFLQGYYDASGVASDNFDQAIQFSGVGNAKLTPEMKNKGISLNTTVAASSYYLGFNMMDPVVGGLGDAQIKLRQAISIAVDEEEFIDIFMNGRGLAAQGLIPPGLFGYDSGPDGYNKFVYDWIAGSVRRKPISEAKRLMAEAGYPEGFDVKTGQPLTLYFDSTLSGADDKSVLGWYRKQFAKLGIQLVLRTTDYNQFQQKMTNGNAQIFRWGWNADYPDPENFFFLLYGENAKVGRNGENAANYKNPDYDRLFKAMRSMPDSPERLSIIRAMQRILQHDAPWVFGLHPKVFSLHHAWYRNFKPNLMANNGLKYLALDKELRDQMRKGWNKPVFWPIYVFIFIGLLMVIPAWLVYNRRMRSGAL